jgi:hypothetical protein
MVNPGFSSQAEAPQPPMQPQGNGMAVAGMVLGILTTALFFTSLIAVVLGILAIIFSIIGIKKARRVGRGKGMAIAGLITGIVGMLLAILLVMAIAVPAFHDYMKKSKQTEAGEQLNRLGKRAKIAFGENGEFPKGAASLTPSADCCGQPKNECATTAADWNSNPVWQALGFEVDGPMHYRYDYSSTDGKSFVAHAVGDLDCDGVPATYELDGTVDASGMPSVLLIKPASGTY